MCVNDLKDIHYLFEYQPHEGRYGKFDSNILLCAFKILDIYMALCNARFNLSSFENDNFGPLVEHTPTGIQYMKHNLYQNALFFYNIAIDLTWQLGWLFIYGSTNNLMPTPELHEDLVKKCTYNNLIAALEKNNRSDLITIYKNFYKYMTQTNIRKNYNYLKHRGNFYYDGLGNQHSKSMVAIRINGKDYQYPVLKRKKINLEEVCSEFVSFDKNLLSYIDQLINIIIPSDYLAIHNDPISGTYRYMSEYKDQLISYYEQCDIYKQRIKQVVKDLMNELCNYIDSTKKK